ncbi:Cell division protein FtsN [Thalassocella blandensis]|nr:Cell division protein FtsN [Thalassocella blandensis]
MAAEHSRRSQASRRTAETRVPAWVWLFTGTVLGAFIMFLVHLSEVNTKVTDTTASSGKEVKTEDKPKQSPRFDFYDLLKETQVSVPETSQEIKKAVEQKPAENTEFILQVASFKSQEDAERLRAELILLNLEAKTEQAKIRNGETWHRVLVGPFTSHSKLAKARSTLLSNNHEALVLKRRPEA